MLAPSCRLQTAQHTADRWSVSMRCWKVSAAVGQPTQAAAYCTVLHGTRPSRRTQDTPKPPMSPARRPIQGTRTQTPHHWQGSRQGRTHGLHRQGLHLPEIPHNQLSLETHLRVYSQERL